MQQIRRTLKRYAMLEPGERVVVAVSGGPDSVALLATLVEIAPAFEVEVGAAHFNHHLRGQESQRDQECAQKVASALGVRCVVGHGVGLRGMPNLEARAREHRYAFLARVAADAGGAKIATGHTMDDQAETLLMRLLRGTGWDGLACIHPVREERIIRPMIDCSRQQVLAFLKARALSFCKDSSNDDRHLLRNRVRHDVVPLLRSINPSVVRALAGAAEILAGEAALLEEQSRSHLPAPTSILPVAAIIAAPAALRGRIVRTWLSAQRGTLRRLTAAHVRAVVDLALGERPGAGIRLPGGERVFREYEQLCWRADEAQAAEEPLQELAPGRAVSLMSGWRISVELVAERGPRLRSLWEMAADAEAVRAPLVVRSARPGDRVRPLGLRGSRKLQDIFVDRKLPRAERWSFPVVEAAGEVLWVPGMVRSDAALITPETRSTLRLIARKTGIAGR